MEVMLSQVAENISFFFIEIENFRGEGKILKRHTHDNFFWKNSWFFQNFRRERTVFPFIFKENGKSEAVFEHFWSARQQFFFERGVTQIWSLFYCKTDNLTCLNKTNCLVNSKVKEFFMCFYVICMNKHVGITLLVFLLVLYTGARGTDHPLFLTFCLQTYFQ